MEWCGGRPSRWYILLNILQNYNIWLLVQRPWCFEWLFFSEAKSPWRKWRLKFLLQLFLLFSKVIVCEPLQVHDERKHVFFSEYTEVYVHMYIYIYMHTIFTCFMLHIHIHNTFIYKCIFVCTHIWYFVYWIEIYWTFITSHSWVPQLFWHQRIPRTTKMRRKNMCFVFLFVNLKVGFGFFGNILPTYFQVGEK